MKRLLLTGITLLFGITLVANGADPLWEKYIAAQITFQDDLAGLFKETNPEFTEPTVISHDLQVTLIQMRQRRYYYLQENNPAAIKRGQGIIKWSNFNWTKEDEEALLKKDPEYAALAEIKAALHEKNQGHPDWPAYRKAFAELGESQRYKDIFGAFMNVSAEIDAELKEAEAH